MKPPANYDSYRLDLAIPPGDAVREVATTESEQVLEVVADARYTMATRIHELRKYTKRVRSLLRLVRKGFPDFKAANVALRDTARLVTSHRDARVMAELTRHLGKAPAANPVCAWFDYKATLADSLAEDRIAEIVERIEEVLTELDHWRFDDIRRADVLGGFNKTYGIVIEQRDLVHDRSESEAAHEWRKHSKDHWYHLLLLHDALPVKERARTDAFHELCGLLGEVHDHDVLLHYLEALPPFLIETRQAGAIRRAAKRERKRLRIAAETLADTLLDDKPAKLTAKVRRKWRALSEAGA